MSDPTIKPIAAATEDELLEQTQAVRVGIVNQFVKKGSAPTDDPKQMSALLKTLEGIDKQVLTKKRMAVDEGLGNKHLQAAATIAALFNDSRSKTFNAIPLEGAAPRTEAPTLDDTIPTPALVPGELESVGTLESYDSFLKRLKTQAPTGAATA